ncbi:MAG: SDR family oxidoreductase [Pyrinomonadaceae bacterium]|nr:SDR family oxidoreductase [Pyrinomonadaceae bacterium]
MKILVFGASGMLGHKLIQQLSPGFDTWGTIRRDYSTIERYGIFSKDRIIQNVDVEDPSSVEGAIRLFEPDVVINAVGVIKQMPTSKDVIKTLMTNAIFPHRVAGLAKKYGFRFITVSTDCVFDGAKGGYTEDDISNAKDLYGKSKSLGEVDLENCLTIRTSIIGRELGTDHSLVEWVLSNRGKQIKGFTNAIYSGFPTIIFADIIANLIVNEAGLTGLFHIASKPINKFDLVSLINEYYNAGIEVVPDGEFKIDRSLDSTRFEQLTGFRPQPWDEMIQIMASDTTPYDKWKQ